MSLPVKGDKTETPSVCVPSEPQRWLHEDARKSRRKRGKGAERPCNHWNRQREQRRRGVSYSQFSVWKSGTNCSSLSGTWAGRHKQRRKGWKMRDFWLDLDPWWDPAGLENATANTEEIRRIFSHKKENIWIWWNFSEKKVFKLSYFYFLKVHFECADSAVKLSFLNAVI